MYTVVVDARRSDLSAYVAQGRYPTGYRYGVEARRGTGWWHGWGDGWWQGWRSEPGNSGESLLTCPWHGFGTGRFTATGQVYYAAVSTYFEQ